MNKNIFKFLCLFLCFTVLSAKNENKSLTDSTPEIVFKYDTLKKNQENMTLQVEFNKAVLLLEKEEYEKAIAILKRTAQIIQIPSFLNIGIAYYKLNSIHNAKLYLNKIYNYKAAKSTQTYSYMSAAYYLYQITNEVKYLESIINIGRKNKNMSEHSKRMMGDTYIILKEYSKAINILKTMDFPLNLKTAMLHLKVKNYIQAEIFLQRAYENTVNLDKKHKILWLMVFRDLKANELVKLKDHLSIINKKKSIFSANLSMPLKMYFNKNKYSSKEYFSFIKNF